MKTKSFLFVSAVIVVAVLCIGIMNIHYDRLSRYPYEDEEARAIIDQYFSDQDIQYLIEYSIAPSTFIRYVPYDGFSIYHAEDYNLIREGIWYLSDEQVVQIVELARTVMTMPELKEKLLNYDSMTVFHYLKNEDPYALDSVLIENPGDLDAYLDNTHTVSTRILFDTAALIVIPSSSDETVMMSEVAIEPLKAMCTAIETELDNQKTCGGLLAEAGYIDYKTQNSLYEAAINQYGEDALFYCDLPGHSEHQLGTSIDFSVKGFKQENFKDSVQYTWLKENAHRFGFVETYTVDNEDLSEKSARPWHWRYVGYELAAQMYFNQITLKEAISWQQ